MPSREDWRKDAACRGLDPALFFPEDDEGHDVLDADPHGVVDRYCRVCPVRLDCLRDADPERGIYGGRVPDER